VRKVLGILARSSRDVFRLQELGLTNDGVRVSLVGEVVAVGTPLAAPYTGRLCVAFQANVAMTTPAGPDVLIARETVPFHLRGDDGVVLVRAELEAIRLRDGVGGGVDGDPKWDEIRVLARPANGIPTNWYERILPVGAAIRAKGIVAHELDPAAPRAGYRDPPRRLVVMATSIG